MIYALREQNAYCSAYQCIYLSSELYQCVIDLGYIYIFVSIIDSKAGDWLQGPYVYALYQHYGFDKGSIGRLFVAGFGSSMVFGTFVGGMADKYGRKLACLLYVATYSLGCMTKYFNSFTILLFGRLLAGISTSLLFSCFESWLVHTHTVTKGFSPSLLSNTFSLAVFFGNGVTAVLSGQVGHVLVQVFGLGPVSPFGAAIVVLVIGGVIIHKTWSENVGSVHNNDTTIDTSNKSPPSYSSLQIDDKHDDDAITAEQQDDINNSHVHNNNRGSESSLSLFPFITSKFPNFEKGLLLIVNDESLLLIGGIQSMFEASMYTFVFMWTPALTPSHGGRYVIYTNITHLQ